MHLHILGICGTFMGSLALLARELGHTVTGSDLNVYPPMSTMLEEQGVTIHQGYDIDQLELEPDLYIIGNAMTRGVPVVEAILDRHLPYTSGPAWLGGALGSDRRVIAVAGTHGKTTTSSMIAWILEHANLSPGFLIGGVPSSFSVSSRIGDGPWFVVEADEYDTAFFDKRSKLVHYRPDIAVINNLEFDHADIFDDLAAIQRQFHHFIRIVPGSGAVIANAADQNVADMLALGCWTPKEFFLGPRREAVNKPHVSVHAVAADHSAFTVRFDDGDARVEWSLAGQHNIENAVAAMCAARAAGVTPQRSAQALGEFIPTKRRLELRAEHRGCRLYDDFAHHPTAIRLTLDAMRAKHPNKRVIALVEPRSNTMKMGVHEHTLADSLSAADVVYILVPSDFKWTLQARDAIKVFPKVSDLERAICDDLRDDDQLVVMSNGSFEGLTDRMARYLNDR